MSHLFQNAQVVPNCPELLMTQVGNSNTEITYDTIEVINLLKAFNDPDFAPYLQFFTPAQIHLMAAEYKNMKVKPQNSKRQKFIEHPSTT